MTVPVGEKKQRMVVPLEPAPRVATSNFIASAPGAYATSKLSPFFPNSPEGSKSVTESAIGIFPRAIQPDSAEIAIASELRDSVNTRELAPPPFALARTMSSARVRARVRGVDEDGDEDDVGTGADTADSNRGIQLGVPTIRFRGSQRGVDMSDPAVDRLLNPAYRPVPPTPYQLMRGEHTRLDE